MIMDEPGSRKRSHPDGTKAEMYADYKERKMNKKRKLNPELYVKSADKADEWLILA